ncbi:hypothetical protein RRG08_047531 [Elysia crispata]|uniref:Uncharacterized protein n=1 Tax=Elysia crispata TaxID=231223 RepID=A0AAE0YQE8_9GAST|nr:hypothetical protein RRG08_047531 [Elysia crispata]
MSVYEVVLMGARNIPGSSCRKQGPPQPGLDKSLTQSPQGKLTSPPTVFTGRVNSQVVGPGQGAPVGT